MYVNQTVVYHPISSPSLSLSFTLFKKMCLLLTLATNSVSWGNF